MESKGSITVTVPQSSILVELTEALKFARYISNEGFYWNEEIKLWVGIFNGKDLTDSEIWDEFRKSKNKTNEQ